MAGSIIDSLMSTLGPQVVGPIVSRLGVSTDAVQSGFESSSAALLSGIASKADQPGFLNQIFGLITNPANSSGALANAISNAGSGAAGTPLSDLGSKFTSMVLGPNQSAITDAIGRVSGLGDKAGAMLGMVGPLVLGFLGQHVRDNGLSASDLGNTLKGEASKLRGLLPAGLGSLLGGVGGVATAAAAAPVAAVGAARRWLWPLIILAAIIIAALWYFNRSKPVTEAEAPEAAAAPAPALPAGWVGLKLPDGVTLNVPENGIENQLVGFITDSSKPVDKTTWFNFDRLTFDTGKATLQQSSQEQLNNVVAILKAYPNVHAKIGGYTDNVGNAAANKKLSDQRARNVMDAIVAGGIDQSRLESEGYGREHPVADNSTADGRAQNRRIALRVTQK